MSRGPLQPVLLVRTSSQASEVSMSFFYHGRQINFLRKREDLVDAVLKRMRLNISKLTQSAVSQKHNKTQEPYIAAPDISFMDSTRNPITSGALGDVLEAASSFSAGDIEYRIVCNAPRPTSVSILHPVVANATVLVKMETESSDLPTQCEFRFSWRVNDLASDEKLFVPNATEVGGKIHVTVSNAELPEFAVEYTCNEPILPDPGFAPFSLQTKIPEISSGRDIRVGSFNVLAQGYVATDIAKTIMYPHIHDERILQFSYRNSLILRELLNFSGDLLLLQEVAPSFVDLCFKPVLAEAYSGNFVMKANSQRPNGVAVLARSSKFRVLEELQWSLGGDELKSAFEESEWSSLASQFGSHFDQVVIPNITTVAAVSVLQPLAPEYQNKSVIVVSTHLFYHPLGGHIRLLQTIALTRKLQVLITKYPESSIILGGDLNSRPERAAVQFLRSGKIDETDDDWKFGPIFRWNFENEDDEGTEVVPNGSLAALDDKTRGISASHDLNLTWSFADDKMPELTHATASFRAVLDYIFVSQQFHVLDDFRNLYPTHAAVDAVGGLPCATYGSDHVLVGAEVQFK